MEYPKRRFPRTLKCDLTDEEVETHTVGATDCQTNIDEENEGLASLALQVKAAKQRIDVKTAEMREHLVRRRERWEHRPVDCFEQYDAATEKMETYREDTSDLIDTRNARDDEKQGLLLSIDGGGADPEKQDDPEASDDGATETTDDGSGESEGEQTAEGSD